MDDDIYCTTALIAVKITRNHLCFAERQTFESFDTLKRISETNVNTNWCLWKRYPNLRSQVAQSQRPQCSQRRKITAEISKRQLHLQDRTALQQRRFCSMP